MKKSTGKQIADVPTDALIRSIRRDLEQQRQKREKEIASDKPKKPKR